MLHDGVSQRATNEHARKLIAERMRGLDGDGAEVTYALAYAMEHLGELDDARKAYEMVLRLDSRASESPR